MRTVAPRTGKRLNFTKVDQEPERGDVARVRQSRLEAQVREAAKRRKRFGGELRDAYNSMGVTEENSVAKATWESYT